MLVVMEEFMKLCGLLGVQGVIDDTHLSILKPQGVFIEDSYYHKTSGYNIIVAQCVVDSNKKNIDLFVGLQGSVNDSRALLQFGLYMKAQYIGLFEIGRASQNGFAPYLLGDKGYPLISWIMTPYKEEGHHFFLKLMYNKKHKRDHFVVENAFGILKKTF
jgi:hypothetical protein